MELPLLGGCTSNEVSHFLLLTRVLVSVPILDPSLTLNGLASLAAAAPCILLHQMLRLQLRIRPSPSSSPTTYPYT